MHEVGTTGMMVLESVDTTFTSQFIKDFPFIYSIVTLTLTCLKLRDFPPDVKGQGEWSRSFE